MNKDQLREKVVQLEQEQERACALQNHTEALGADIERLRAEQQVRMSWYTTHVPSRESAPRLRYKI